MVIHISVMVIPHCCTPHPLSKMAQKMAKMRASAQLRYSVIEDPLKRRRELSSPKQDELTTALF